MTTYQTEQIKRFLEAVDKHQRKPVRLVVIGGSAALLQHGARSPTRDIDTFEGNPALVSEAAALAEAEIGFAVPIASAAVADLPLNYEDRQLRPLPRLRRLDLVVPDRYDLVLSKLLRASQADLAVCQEMHEHEPLDPTKLVKRYLDEMNHAIGREADRDQNLIAAVEFMWDEAKADRAEHLIRQRRSAKQAGRSSATGNPRRSPRRK